MLMIIQPLQLNPLSISGVFLVGTWYMQLLILIFRVYYKSKFISGRWKEFSKHYNTKTKLLYLKECFALINADYTCGIWIIYFECVEIGQKYGRWTKIKCCNSGIQFCVCSFSKRQKF